MQSTVNSNTAQIHMCVSTVCIQHQHSASVQYLQGGDSIVMTIEEGRAASKSPH